VPRSGVLHLSPVRFVRTATGLVNFEMPNTKSRTSPAMIKRSASHPEWVCAPGGVHHPDRYGSRAFHSITTGHREGDLILAGKCDRSIELGVNELRMTCRPGC